MTPVTVFAGRTVAVFGLGGSGLATAKALRAGNAEVVVWDDTTASVLAAEAQGLYAADLRTLDWTGVAALILSPGVPLTHPEPHWTVALARAAGVEIIGDIELLARQRRATAPGTPLLAITGTNGKSTTTALIAHILRHAGRDVQMGGNIGTAALLLEPPSPERVHVLECSSYQIDLAPTLDASVGILLNLTEDHLDRHGTMDRYAEIKERLVALSDTAVIAVDDEFTREAAERLVARFHPLVLVSAQSELPDGIVLDGETLVRVSAGRREVLASLAGIGSLRGRHNAQNAAAAAAAVLALGLSLEEVAAGLGSFPGLAHRMEEVGRRGAVLIVNDSKATNADAAAKALASFSDVFWIAGGRPKTGGIESLRPFFPRIRHAYLIGEAEAEFGATLEPDVPVTRSGTLENAVASAVRDAAASGLAEPVVLLSPACASFDQFRNFEVRGDRFRELVRALL